MSIETKKKKNFFFKDINFILKILNLKMSLFHCFPIFKRLSLSKVLKIFTKNNEKKIN